jgi:hypothetical protein
MCATAGTYEILVRLATEQLRECLVRRDDSLTGDCESVALESLTQNESPAKANFGG